MFVTRKYISKQGAKDVLNFKYDGSDPSLAYKYFHSPLADFLVKYTVPVWVSPNILTLLGFLCTLSSHFIYFYYSNGTMESDHYPPWIHLYGAIALFVYSVLDNMDGKQARRTGTGSVLGSTLDHGVDCVNAGVIGISLIASMNMVNIKAYYAMAVVAFLPIFTAAWEEYHVGGMFMPKINGPNEGLFAIEVAFLLTYFYGPGFWMKEAFFGFARAEILMGYVIFIGELTAIQNMIRVFKQKRPDSVLKRFLRLRMIIFIFICIILVQACSPTNIAIRRGRWVIYFFLLGWAKCVTLVHLWYGTSQEINLLRRLTITVPFAIFTANAVLGHFMGKAPIDEDLLLNVGVAFMLIMYLQFARSVLVHLAEILKINIFTIPYKKHKD